MAKPKDKMSGMAPSLHLGHDDLKQFGLHTGPLPKVGDKLPLSATAHIKGVGETDMGRHMSVELHDMKVGQGKQLLKPDGDSEQMKKGMKKAVDKAVVGPKEEGDTEPDGDEA